MIDTALPQEPANPCYRIGCGTTMHLVDGLFRCARGHI